MRDYTNLNERDLLILILEALEKHNELLQVIADKPSGYSGKPQKPKLGEVWYTQENNFLWFEIAGVFGAERKFDKEATAARKQAIVIAIQLLAGQDMQALKLRQVAVEREGKEGKKYTAQCLQFNWCEQTKKVFAQFLEHPDIGDSKEYYIKFPKELFS